MQTSFVVLELEEGEIRSTSEDNSNELSDAPNNLNNRFDPSRFRECNDSPQHLGMLIRTIFVVEKQKP